MKVLVSCKTTNLDVHGEAIKRKVASGLLSQEHLNRLVEDHEHHQASKEQLLTLLTKSKVEWREVGRGSFWPSLEGIDAVISVGGDGTLLEASQHIVEEKVPLLGLRSSPMSVGHLCAFKEDEISGLVDAFVSRQLACLEVHRIKARVTYTETGGSSATPPILNDFLYANANPAATSRYRIHFGNSVETQKSSGIWISTAAGSSAAVHAAGGEIMDLSDNRCQFIVRELYSPDEEATKPQISKAIFDLHKHSLKIENLSDKAILALDGKREQIALYFGDVIEILPAPPILLLRK